MPNKVNRTSYTAGKVEVTRADLLNAVEYLLDAPWPQDTCRIRTLLAKADDEQVFEISRYPLKGVGVSFHVGALADLNVGDVWVTGTLRETQPWEETGEAAETEIAEAVEAVKKAEEVEKTEIVRGHLRLVPNED